jgi:hypothetical protein
MEYGKVGCLSGRFEESGNIVLVPGLHLNTLGTGRGDSIGSIPGQQSPLYSRLQGFVEASVMVSHCLSTQATG